jgi:hypothetical protein
MAAEMIARIKKMTEKLRNILIMAAPIHRATSMLSTASASKFKIEG